MKTTLLLDGLKELEAAMMELPKTTNKRLATRVLKKAGQVIADAATLLVPVGLGDKNGHHLKDVIGVSAGLNKNQRRKSKKESAVEMHVGPQYSADIQRARIGHLVEFGTAKSAARPYMRPAFDAKARAAFDIIKDGLSEAVQKAVKRHERKQARRGR